MSIKSSLQKLRSSLRPQNEWPDETLSKFLKILEDVRREDITCEEMYKQMDQFVDQEVNHHDAAVIMPLLQEHIDTCGECCDEYQALLTVLQRTRQN